MRSSPLRTAAMPRAAASLQLTYHCGTRRGSMMSLLREHTPMRIGLGDVPRKSPFFLSASMIARRASKRFIPANSPQSLVSVPSTSNMLIISRWLRSPHS